MHYDGRCHLWLRSDLTISVLSAETAGLINAVHAALPMPKPAFQQATYAAGDMNPYILLLNDLDMGGAPWTRARKQELAFCGPIINQEFLTVEYMRLILAFGGDIEGCTMVLEVSNLNATIPGNLPFSGRKWSDLDTGTFPWTPLNNKFYRATNLPSAIVDRGNDGQPMNASEWATLMALGVTILTTEQYQALQPPAPGPL